jgi:hypothetical protein
MLAKERTAQEVSPARRRTDVCWPCTDLLKKPQAGRMTARKLLLARSVSALPTP